MGVVLQGYFASSLCAVPRVVCRQGSAGEIEWGILATSWKPKIEIPGLEE